MNWLNNEKTDFYLTIDECFPHNFNSKIEPELRFTEGLNFRYFKANVAEQTKFSSKKVEI